MEQKIIDSLKSKEKPITESSIKLYVLQLKKLNDDKPITNLNFLRDVDKIKEKISKYKPNTQRNKYIAIVSVLKNMPKFKKLYDKYYTILIDLSKSINASDKGEKTETQQKNWINFEDIQKLQEDYMKIISNYKNKKSLNNEEYTNLLKTLVLSLYVDLPPRRNDYKNMLISNNDKDLDPNFNYYIKNKNKFIFQNYKSVKTHGKQEIDIPENLQNIIKIYLKFYPNKDKEIKYFLVNYNGQEFKAINSLTYFLNSIFNKNISSTMLRHIYLDKYKNVKEEQAKDAELMGHTTEMQADYIKK